MSVINPKGQYKTVIKVQAGPRPSIRQPSSETGIYLRKHKHVWQETGTHTWESGKRDPVFVCAKCGDVICSPAVRRTDGT